MLALRAMEGTKTPLVQTERNGRPGVPGSSQAAAVNLATSCTTVGITAILAATGPRWADLPGYGSQTSCLPASAP